ncbi:hypothetical protein [Actinomadura sp. 7K534]|uniref:hypothetical protein n=1 Tax=Actinomadura sp. 7K534 TaxID=2530366 RepID=UPI00140553C3|nr:hypothetical protein [Actinomadura sp. 7K534]
MDALVTVGGSYVAVGPDGTVIVAPAGDDLDAGGVRNRDTFALVGPMPGEVAARFLGGWSSEPWLRSGPESQPIHLFVRRPAPPCCGCSSRAGTRLPPMCLNAL